MLKVGITGGMGSGKTTVCKVFETLDIPVYYADSEAKNILQKDRNVKNALKNILGVDAYHKNGRPNRSFISKKIFNDKILLEKINALVHPAVQKHSDSWVASCKNIVPPPPFVLVEAALLVENGSYTNFDKIIVVTCPEETRVQRVMSRDKISESIVRERISNQMTESQKVAVADYVIVNNDHTPLLPQIYSIYTELKIEGIRTSH